MEHASVAFTMDVYSHIIEGRQSDIMALLSEGLPAGQKGISQKDNAANRHNINEVLPFFFVGR